MEPLAEDPTELVKNSQLYKEFLAEREEVLRYKWIESEKVGYDIGFERRPRRLDGKASSRLATPKTAAFRRRNVIAAKRLETLQALFFDEQLLLLGRKFVGEVLFCFR